MAVFKRFTQQDGRQVDVNMDLVMFAIEYEGFTSLTFGSGLGISVKETANEIALAPALRFNSGPSRLG
ncbi:hypothetical protein [Bradyrhizobium sp. 150]|uniref:hypothetical protein n=1 Tax=Bradyrhizobium sp. 150 TaxID=2782625 RepID=UPI001FFA16D5|nr:hypothetical protein [Bradyrhizobium sp. 150]MCK1670410.1 hypothetical protein [Bradyrhizobium sp. 150]